MTDARIGHQVTSQSSHSSTKLHVSAGARGDAEALGLVAMRRKAPKVDYGSTRHASCSHELATMRDHATHLALAALVLVAGIVLFSTISCGGGSPTAGPSPTVVGVVGCSQTSFSWNGWIATGDPQPWQTQIGDYGGGAVARWALQIPDGHYWMRLDSNIEANVPATAVWWQLCDLLALSATTTDAEEVLAEIRNRFPDTTVYASPLAEYVDPTICPEKGNFQNSNALVDHLVTTGQVERGPVLPIQPEEWGCGPTPPKVAAFGAALADFTW